MFRVEGHGCCLITTGMCEHRRVWRYMLVDTVARKVIYTGDAGDGSRWFPACTTGHPESIPGYRMWDNHTRKFLLLERTQI